MTPIHWDDRPSSTPTPRIPIQVFSVPPNARAFLRLLGPPKGVWLHWTPPTPQAKGRTVPCLETECPHCPAPAYWRGYAPALLYKQLLTESPTRWEWVPVVCPLADEHAAALAHADLRGVVIELHRRGSRHNSPVECTIVETAKVRWRNGAPPPPFDVTPILLRMWGVRHAAPSAEPADAGAAWGVIARVSPCYGDVDSDVLGQALFGMLVFSSNFGALSGAAGGL